MTGTAPRRQRLLVAVVVALFAIVTAAGPSGLARALGARSVPAGPGFLPEPAPVRVTAPRLLLTDLRAIAAQRPVELAGGGRSPADTTLLEFAAIDLDDLVIAQSVGASPGSGPFDLAIADHGARPATIGGPGETTDLWGVLHRLDLCLSVATLTTLVGGLPPSLLTTLVRLVAGLVPTSSVGPTPCFPLRQLLPVLGALLDAGVPLPASIPANDLDIDVYALHVTTPDGRTSLRLPDATLTVRDR